MAASVLSVALWRIHLERQSNCFDMTEGRKIAFTMQSKMHLAVVALAAHVLTACSSLHLPPHAASGTRGVVASVHPLATQAGINAYQRGGNAVDAAIAAAVTLGVVDAHNSGIGGGCFVLIRKADGQLLAIDGREMAPAAATRDMFL